LFSIATISPIDWTQAMPKIQIKKQHIAMKKKRVGTKRIRFVSAK